MYRTIGIGISYSILLFLSSCTINTDNTVPVGYPYGDWVELKIERLNLNTLSKFNLPNIYSDTAQWNKHFPNDKIDFDFEKHDLLMIHTSTEYLAATTVRIQDRVIVNTTLRKALIETRFHTKYTLWFGGSKKYISHINVWYKIPKISDDFSIEYRSN